MKGERLKVKSERHRAKGPSRIFRSYPSTIFRSYGAGGAGGVNRGQAHRAWGRGQRAWGIRERGKRK